MLGVLKYSKEGDQPEKVPTDDQLGTQADRDGLDVSSNRNYSVCTLVLPALHCLTKVTLTLIQNSLNRFLA